MLHNHSFAAPKPRARRATVAQLVIRFAALDRREIAAGVEGLIALLDATTPDCDLEPEQDCCNAHDDNPEDVSVMEPWAGQHEDDEDDEPLARLPFQRARSRPRQTRPRLVFRKVV